MEITIQQARLEDIPILAELNRQAYHLEIASRISWKNWPDVDNMRNFFASRLRLRMETASTDMFKAVSTSTQEVVGLIALSRETVSEAGAGHLIPTPTENAARQLPPGLNAAFVTTVGSRVERLRELMKVEEHFCRGPSDLVRLLAERIPNIILLTDISTFAVGQQFQGRGVGTRLLLHCLQIADNAGLPIWLIAFPGSHDLYLRNNFVDVDHVDIDLDEYDGRRYRGFGIYRNFAMRRQSHS